MKEMTSVSPKPEKIEKLKTFKKVDIFVGDLPTIRISYG